MKHTALLALLLLSTPVLAQTLPDPAAQRAQTQNQINQQQQQTQNTNIQNQVQIQQDQIRQQNVINAMPAPAYQQPRFAAPPPPRPATP